MKQKKRNFIPFAMDKIIFDKSNNKSHEWYYDYSKSLPVKFTIGISAFGIHKPDTIDVILTYIDLPSKAHLKNGLEFIEESTYKFSKSEKNRYAIDIPIVSKIKTKLLWKVGFAVKSKVDKLDLHFSLSH